jgi:hypothetical protein
VASYEAGQSERYSDGGGGGCGCPAQQPGKPGKTFYRGVLGAVKNDEHSETGSKEKDGGDEPLVPRCPAQRCGVAFGVGRVNLSWLG